MESELLLGEHHPVDPLDASVPQEHVVHEVGHGGLNGDAKNEQERIRRPTQEGSNP